MYKVSGNTLRFVGTDPRILVGPGGHGFSFSCPLELAGNLTLEMRQSYNFAINGTVSGPGSFTVTGGGGSVLGHFYKEATYTGPTLIAGYFSLSSTGGRLASSTGVVITTAGSLSLASARERPDGLIILDDMLFDDAKTAIRDLGIRLPDDLAVVTHANANVPLSAPFPFSRAVFDPDACAEAMGALLLGALRRQPSASTTRTLGFTWCSETWPRPCGASRAWRVVHSATSPDSSPCSR